MGNQGSINTYTAPKPIMEGIVEALQAAHLITALPGAIKTANLIAARHNPASAESQFARAGVDAQLKFGVDHNLMSQGDADIMRRRLYGPQQNNSQPQSDGLSPEEINAANTQPGQSKQPVNVIAAKYSHDKSGQTQLKNGIPVLTFGGSSFDLQTDHNPSASQTSQAVQNAVNPSVPSNPKEQGKGYMTAAALDADTTLGPLYKLWEGQQSADALKNRLDYQHQFTKSQSQDSAHQALMGRLSSDENLKQGLAAFQGIQNAFNLITKVDNVTPEIFHKFQTKLATALGRTSGGGVDERKTGYLDSVGIRARDYAQFLTNVPSNMNANDPFLVHAKQEAQIESQNLKTQMLKHANSLISGYDSTIYNNRPDLKQDALNRLTAISNELSDSDQAIPKGKGISINVLGSAPGPGTNVHAATLPKVGEIRKGHKYTGGNPAKESSWEKVK